MLVVCSLTITCAPPCCHARYTLGRDTGGVNSSTDHNHVPTTAIAPSSFDDDVRTSARYQARLLRELGYRADATHIDRFVDRQNELEDEEPAA